MTINPAEEAEGAGHTYDGTLVGMSSDALVIRTKENKTESFRVASDAYVCCDGVTCAVGDLKFGSKVRLTSQASNADVATIVESLVDQTDFADHR
jgi:hypothetical protein